MKIGLLNSHSHSPYYNLAMEDHLLRNENDYDLICFFYINDPSIVLGNFQCLWKEIPLDRFRELNEVEKINLARRQSGGGTVYHDHGNLNFSFIFSKEKFPKNHFNQYLVEYFKHHQLKVSSSGRDDLGILQEDTFYKFSGQAFKQTRDKVLHHGTLLFNTNLETLNQLCRPNKKNIESKSVDSVVSKVLNLKDKLGSLESTMDFKLSIESHFNDRYGAILFNCDAIIDEKINEYQSDAWVMNKTPNFTLNIKDMRIYVEKSFIARVELINSDECQNSFCKILNQNLVGHRLKTELLPKVELMRTEINDEKVDLFFQDFVKFLI